MVMVLFSMLKQLLTIFILFAASEGQSEVKLGSNCVSLLLVVMARDLVLVASLVMIISALSR